jgi:hypothetical protein
MDLQTELVRETQLLFLRSFSRKMVSASRFTCFFFSMITEKPAQSVGNLAEDAMGYW